LKLKLCTITSNITSVNQCDLYFVKMQQDTNTTTQSVIDYFNISNFCMNKVRKFAMKFSYFIIRKIVKTVATAAHQRSDFKAKMHQIRFRLGLRPDPAVGAYSAPPNRILGALLLMRGRGREGKEERGRKRKGRKGMG